MIEPGLTNTDAIPFESSPGNGAADTLAALKQRIHRLEDAVAALQDTRALEDRLVERVSDRVRPSEPANAEPASGVLSAASRRLLPVLSVVRNDEEPAPPPAAIPISPPPPHSSWLILDLFQEVRTILRMYFDRHYRMGRTARLAPIIALVVVILSWFFLDGHFLLIGTILDRLVDLGIFIVTYRILSREAERYRATLVPPAVARAS